MKSETKPQGISRWFAVYTKPRWEKKIVELLNEKGIECYCPLVKVRKQWSDRKKIVLEPLIKSYVFVCIRDDEHMTVRNTPGVVNFVYWLGKPAVVITDDIIRIKKFLNEYEHVRAEKEEVKLNDIVRILSGPFMMEEGKIVGIRKQTIKLILPRLGLALVAEVRKDNIELANAK